MDPYSMPQLDKASPVYTDAAYEGGPGASGNVKKYSPVSSEALPHLTHSAWSAVIHQPAEDDSEPDDLPSTVDMDAIKGSPATPLAASKSSLCPGDVGWSPETVEKGESGEEEESKGKEGEGSDSEDSDDDTDSRSDDESGGSETANNSASDSEGSGTGTCTWSDSDSGSSSYSSHSGRSSRSSQNTTHQTTFSIRETNFEQVKFSMSSLY
ncbi:unnamed protein product [Timema podura]|uniref:Uncharacterized protein n=1 Tax=Timema podura TaxID=61482 RepID=A0ABN7P551_TIMPD|nr:unnamed protein product [Timema podura]